MAAILSLNADRRAFTALDFGDGTAGTVNGEGALEVRTTRAVGDRTLDRVIRLVEDAQTSKAPTQQFTERFERLFRHLHIAGEKFKDILLNEIRVILDLSGGYREVFFKPFRIIYRVSDAKVFVLLVADGRRDMRALLQRRLLEF